MTLPEPDLKTCVGPLCDLSGTHVGPVWDWRPERTWTGAWQLDLVTICNTPDTLTQ